MCTIVNYGIFYVLFAVAHLHYLVAASLGFLSGVVIGYPLNRRFTFSVDKSGKREKALYLFVYIVSLILSIIFLRIVVGFLGVDARIANILSIGLTTCTNFIGTKLVVFRK